MVTSNADLVPVSRFDVSLDRMALIISVASQISRSINNPNDDMHRILIQQVVPITTWAVRERVGRRFEGVR
jgi:hypothetical protein